MATHEWAIGRYMWGISGRKVYGKRASQVLGAWARDRGVAFVLMFDAFERSTDSPLFFACDGHFTPNGHRLAASVLRDHLVARALALVER